MTKPQAGLKPWQNTKVSNISELRSETRESKLVKTGPGRANWNFKRAPTCAKLMIPLVINHLMSTCFRRAQDPMERADQRLLAAPANKCAFISGGAKNQWRLNIMKDGRHCSTFFKQLR